MKLSVLLTSLLASAAAGAAVTPREEQDSPVSYAGFKVFRVATNGRPSRVEARLADSGLVYEQWNDDVATHIDVVVAPGNVAAFEALGSLSYRVMHEDLGASIAAESEGAHAFSLMKRQAGVSGEELHKRQIEDGSWFDSYHNYEDHIDYFRALHAAFPNNSEIISAGRSYQDRNIFGIHLWGADGPGKPAVLYHGTVHAREWIVAPVVEYITRQLVTGYNDGNEDVVSILDRYDFFIFPFVNPDGFVYSQTTNRLWRKNRQPAPTGTCFGRDINRNWVFGWDSNPRGASRNPCSETYQGEAASDAPENRGLDAYLRSLRDGPGVKLFIDWHSYGQYILYPFGYAETLYAPEQGKWTRTASFMSQYIRDSSSRRTTYTFGASGSTLYATTGAAPDHAYVIGGADFSFTIELSDTGDYGFVLPPERIRGVAEESWVGQQIVLALLDEEFFDGVGPAQLYQGQT
ncbi:zinc carboxypeptidase [Stachybotrys elegans]|uniref:Zinc carboxypeptidase n=1 Tax=Stachybotrys elegans TaxID=80388 RepID=A0A8K0WQK0_9HYPO|nr:zinc carboxypeptidase [Stachybotrys elegans]